MSTHSIVHVEFAAHDFATVGKFYADLFGWKIQAIPEMEYMTFDAGEGPRGGFVHVDAAATPVVETPFKAGSVRVYVSTDDIDATLARVEELGGKRLIEKTEIPQTGWFGVFADPTGNEVGLFTAMNPGA